jgi:hypothetical protein
MLLSQVTTSRRTCCSLALALMTSGQFSGAIRGLPNFTPDSEIPYLSNVVKEKIKNPIYQFGTESSVNDPRLQSEDLGANQMETNEVGTRNLKFIMKHLG